MPTNSVSVCDYKSGEALLFSKEKAEGCRLIKL